MDQMLTERTKAFENRNQDPTVVSNLTMQKDLANTWRNLEPSANIHVVPTIQEALELIEDITYEAEAEVEIFVTGSLHLVGGVLSTLEGISTSVARGRSESPNLLH